MKKIFTLISIFAISTTGLWAQATPNAGFETWTTTGFPSYDTPTSWNNANSQTAITGVTSCKKSTSAHSGSYAIELVTSQIGSPFNQLVPGFATTGTLPSSITGPLTGGIAYTLRPDSITGWYKYSPQGGENGFVGFILFGSAANNADTIAKAGFSTPTTAISTYTRFSAALVYTSSPNPVANSMWLLSSSNDDGLTASIGSTIYVDDLNLVFNPASGIAEPINADAVTLYPNPVADHLEIRNLSNSKIKFVLYDVTGRKMIEKKISGVANIDVHAFSNGLYFYSIIDENNSSVKAGKLIVQK